MKTPAVFLALLVCAFAAPDPKPQDAEFIDTRIPLRGGVIESDTAEGDAASDDGGFPFFRFPVFSFPSLSFPRFDSGCDDSSSSDASFPSFSSGPFCNIFQLLDRGMPDVKYDFENTTQEERVFGDSRVVCNKTIKTSNHRGIQTMVVSETCYTPGQNEDDQGVTTDNDNILPEVSPEAMNPEVEGENINTDTNEIPRGITESTDGLRKRERRGLWWWPLFNKDHDKHPTHTLINLITDDNDKKIHTDSATKDWSLRVTTVPPQAELHADFDRVIDLSGDTRVNYANRDYTQESMAEVDPDAEVFDWDLVMKEAKANSYEVAPHNYQTYPSRPASPSGAFERIPVRSEPLRSLPMKSEPLRSLPMRSEPLRSLPMKSEPLRSLPMTSEPVRSLPMRSEPLRSLPMRSEPLRSLPMTSEPIRSLPMRSEPLRSHPVGHEPFAAAEPIRSYSARSESLHSSPLPGESKPFRYTYRSRNLR